MAEINEDFKPITSQEQLDSMLKDRLDRKEKAVRSEYGDYEDLKAKAQKYDEAQEAAKTELEKAQERAKKAEDELATMQAQKARAELAMKVSAATGVPANLIQGSDEATMTASANAIATFAKSQHPHVPGDKGGAATPPAPVTKASIYAIEDKAARDAAIAAHMDLFM